LLIPERLFVANSIYDMTALTVSPVLMFFEFNYQLLNKEHLKIVFKFCRVLRFQIIYEHYGENCMTL